eukprot:5542678-Pleurochrysis_carterae.AAC.1
MLEARVEIRLASFFECCIEHWSYMTAKDYDPDDPAVRTERKAKMHELGKALADAFLDIMGSESQCTYSTFTTWCSSFRYLWSELDMYCGFQ